jgi:hypothetical protein
MNRLGYGGAIFVESVAKLDIDHSVFIHNHAQKGGGNSFVILLVTTT